MFQEGDTVRMTKRQRSKQGGSSENELPLLCLLHLVVMLMRILKF